MKRRGAIVAGAAVLGAGGGVATALWRAGRSSSPSVTDASDGAPIDLWSASFQTIDGHVVAMRTLRGRPLLLNFWATWCAPCVVEMPLLDTFRRDHATSAGAWQILALAVDEADPVRRFLAARTLTLPIALAGVDGLDLSRHLGNSAGALPYTVVFDAAGKRVGSKLGAVNERLLQNWVATTR